ncbi:hypothetical protein CMI45_00140 [Candidatus Pacearchaeota archaeon]|nr:hypothetical protein [Candidatus Pacearchaeota archaeon]|tara:strand:- start:3632 stop:4189 length:558 start_codon:yes stop_codon:yes gene_type:complete
MAKYDAELYCAETGKKFSRDQRLSYDAALNALPKEQRRFADRINHACVWGYFLSPLEGKEKKETDKGKRERIIEKKRREIMELYKPVVRDLESSLFKEPFLHQFEEYSSWRSLMVKRRDEISPRNKVRYFVLRSKMRKVSVETNDASYRHEINTGQRKPLFSLSGLFSGFKPGFSLAELVAEEDI